MAINKTFLARGEKKLSRRACASELPHSSRGLAHIQFTRSKPKPPATQAYQLIKQTDKKTYFSNFFPPFLF